MAENFSKYKFELMTNINCNFVTTDKIDFSVKTNIDKSLYINSKFIQSNSISSQENSLSQRNYIAKKTNRGRKEKNKLDNDQLKCQVCFAFEEISTEDLISCSICKCLFHKSCFSQYSNASFAIIPMVFLNLIEYKEYIIIKYVMIIYPNSMR